jgi:hypothetical protein
MQTTPMPRISLLLMCLFGTNLLVAQKPASAPPSGEAVQLSAVARPYDPDFLLRKWICSDVAGAITTRF